MRIDQLRYLIEISRYNSLSLAADASNISTQALSSSIKNLEIELDTVLLNRTNRGVSLTENGKKVLQYAITTIDGYENLQNELRPTANSALTGTLYIYTTPVFLESILPSKIKEFQTTNPNVSVQVIQCSTNEICNAVQGNTQPVLGCVVLPCIKDKLLRDFLPTGDFLFHPINTSRYVCCVPKTSPLAKYKTVSIKKILKEPIVIYTTGVTTNSPLLHILKQYEDNLSIASTTSSITFWAKSIKDNMGIGLLNNLFTIPDSMVKTVFDDLVFIKPKESLIAINGFLYTDNSDPLITAFMNQFPIYHPSKNDPIFCNECITL